MARNPYTGPPSGIGRHGLKSLYRTPLPLRYRDLGPKMRLQMTKSVQNGTKMAQNGTCGPFRARQGPFWVILTFLDLLATIWAYPGGKVPPTRECWPCLGPAPYWVKIGPPCSKQGQKGLPKATIRSKRVLGTTENRPEPAENRPEPLRTAQNWSRTTQHRPITGP